MKKVLLLIIMIIFVFSASLFSEEQVLYADYNSLETILLQNNSDLKILKNNKDKAFMDYMQAKIKSNGIEYKNYYPNDYIALLKISEIIQPMSAKLQYDILFKTYNNTKEVFKNTLRDMISGLYSQEAGLNISRLKMELEEDKYKQALAKYDAGFIIKNELDLAKLDMDTAKVNYKNALRSQENFKRELNTFLGIGINREVENAVLPLNDNINLDEDSGAYIMSALENRTEIFQINETINIIKEQMTILEENRVNTIYQAFRKQYDGLKDSLKENELKLQKTKLDIQKEIETSYIKLLKDKNNISSLENAISNQKANYNNLLSMYNQGMVLKTDTDVLKIAIMEMESNLKLLKYLYNTGILKLEASSCIDNER
jgi:outer membrane protein TolC